MQYGEISLDDIYLSRFQKIVDIDNDGVNEVLVTGEDIEKTNRNKYNRIVCFNNKGKVIWEYWFKDKINTQKEKLNGIYRYSLIVNVVEKKHRKELYLYANNFDSFAGVIFKLDLKTGKRLEGVFWNSGHIQNAIIDDYNHDGKLELICNSYNNSYEKCGVFIIDIDRFSGRSPAIKGYNFYGYGIPDFETYILIPNSDYNKYLNYRNNVISGGSLKLSENGNKITFTASEDIRYFGMAGIIYYLSPNLKDFDIVIGSTFRVLRDTLVAHGKLKLKIPTDSPEYCNWLKSQILYWNGNKFVKREELN
ncbi:MAG: hypothetical protein C4539_00655 [Ignavibacteriales bacterium]|nr:MAG: hypothetical protein C4539_00655 [Ignavibacteriales bacterium]